MSGQYPGQFGPPPGGTPHRPGPEPIPGRFGVPGRVLCALAPLLSVGLLGVVPSLLLAVRRRRAYDIVGAGVFCALLLTVFVSAGIAGSLQDPTADATGQTTLIVLWFAAPVHYLVMDSRAVWQAGRPRPAAPYLSPYAVTMPGYGTPVAPAAPIAAPVAPVAPVAPAAETAHDLRQLGELLRRQAREDRP
ncbi:hypothetical protein P3T27_002971 [Kitasatospora sp. MAA19]|uniref:hypothetical protein n=1 Tax=unclassified Kitasatospora TaxID=2633591 RepID=UPI0024772669|nr:hypothetical protein [Kitasatospora sp. MAA19]MDH6706248.1 hypothetical protein [Kitasatospora sp. MAA19]